MAHQDKQSQNLQVWSLSLTAALDPLPFVIVERAWDCSPVRVHFGRLRELLAPQARYWCNLPTGGWKLLTLDELKHRKGGRAPQCGILEMLGQRVQLSWASRRPDGFSVAHRQELPVLPVFISRANASNQLSAVLGTIPPLDLHAMRGLCENTIFLVLALNGDLCSANTRMKMAVAAAAQSHNEQASGSVGYILILDVQCSAHIIHRLMELAFRMDKLIPSLHATAFTASFPATYVAMLSALKAIVTDDLATEFYPHSQPDAAAQRHNWIVIEMTLLRERTTRARNESECPYDDENTMALASALHKLLNGDWTLPRVQHFCGDPTCCDGFSRSTCVEKVVSLLAEAWFGPLGKKLPAQNRWHTFGPTLQVQGGGHLCHAILPRVLARALRVEAGVGDNDDVDESSYQVYMNAKARKSKEFNEGEHVVETLGIALLGSEPVDKISARMQHLDKEMSSLRELVRPDGPLVQGQAHYWALLNPESASVHAQKIPAILRYVPEHHKEAASARLRTKVCSTSRFYGQ